MSLKIGDAVLYKDESTVYNIRGIIKRFSALGLEAPWPYYVVWSDNSSMFYSEDNLIYLYEPNELLKDIL